ncbi:MAG: DUF4262 domain-containing protein [Candidatus Sulfotelmatobacter sp.]
MATEAQRKLALDRIKENIARSGHYIYVVSGEATPRFAYTIGVSELIGVELILAGAVFYMKDQVITIINDISNQLKAQRDRQVLEVSGHGSFTLRKAHASWATEFMLGALDYYRVKEIPALQIVPDEAHWTSDVPDLTAPWSAITEPAWRWLHEPWTYPVSKEATATTNLAALRGNRITEAARWEDDDWEMFAGAGPDVPKDEMRVVPLGTLLAADEALVPVISLRIGSGLWRDATSVWHPWETRGQSSLRTTN